MNTRCTHGEKHFFDTEVIFSRLIGLQASCRGVDIDEALKFELAPVPPSMFEDSGNMRDADGKSVLNAAMCVKTSQII